MPAMSVAPVPAGTPGTVRVAVEAPQHSGLLGPLDYLSPGPLQPGQLLRVPLGSREVLGIVWHADAGPDNLAKKPVGEVFESLPPMAANWLALLEFAAGYYQRSVGELALAVLPPELRKLDAQKLTRRLARLRKSAGQPRPAGPVPELPALAAAQAAAVQAIVAAMAEPAPVPMLLQGVKIGRAHV